MGNCDWITNIKNKICTRVVELKDKQELLSDLVDDAFHQIMRHSNASAYKREWDNVLVNCVVTLYNYLGVEGSTHRSAGGISDDYESSNILSPILSRNIPTYIKPLGYVFPDTRFDMPE